MRSSHLRFDFTFISDMWAKRRGGKRIEAKSQDVQKLQSPPKLTTYNAYGASTSGIQRTDQILEVEDDRPTKCARQEGASSLTSGEGSKKQSLDVMSQWVSLILCCI